MNDKIIMFIILHLKVAKSTKIVVEGISRFKEV